MANEKTDVVIVGEGAAGGLLAAELGKAIMKGRMNHRDTEAPRKQEEV